MSYTISYSIMLLFLVNCVVRTCSDRTCRPGLFKCSTSGQCIPALFVCDGHRDCPDGDDESPSCNSPERACGINYQCKSGQCIRFYRECDGRRNCTDGSDESPSCASPDRTCRTGWFKCIYGLCVPNSWVCDGRRHCPDGDDESPTCNNPESQSTTTGSDLTVESIVTTIDTKNSSTTSAPETTDCFDGNGLFTIIGLAVALAVAVGIIASLLVNVIKVLQQIKLRQQQRQQRRLHEGIEIVDYGVQHAQERPDLYEQIGTRATRGHQAPMATDARQGGAIGQGGASVMSLSCSHGSKDLVEDHVYFEPDNQI